MAGFSRVPIRQRLTGVAKAALFFGGAVRIARVTGHHNSMPVLCYHSVSRDADYCPPTIAVPPKLFDRQIAYLSRHYRVIRIEEVVQCLAGGTPFPARAAAITFDDGYADNRNAALPLLRKHGVSAMFYVTAGPVIERRRFWVGWLQRAIGNARDPGAIADAMSVPRHEIEASRGIDRQGLIDTISQRINGGSREAREETLARLQHSLERDGPSPDGVDFMMNQNDLRALLASGMEIGSHTVSHTVLTGLDDSEAADELGTAREMLEQAISVPVTNLAYPNGPRQLSNFDDRIVDLARSSGYASAVTSVRGTLDEGADPLRIIRQGINYRIGLSAFAFKLEERRFRKLLLK